MLRRLYFFVKELHQASVARKNGELTELEKGLLGDLTVEADHFELVNSKNHPLLLTDFENLCQKAKLDYLPKLVIYKNPVPRATLLYTGTIAISDSLENEYDREEKKFILAHEIGHIKNKKKENIVSIAALTAPLIGGGIAGKYFTPGYSRVRNALTSTLTIIGAFKAVEFCSSYLFCKFRKQQEYVADKEAIALTRDIDAAKSAFMKVSNDPRIDHSRVLKTHPSIYSRISHLENVKRQSSYSGEENIVRHR